MRLLVLLLLFLNLSYFVWAEFIDDDDHGPPLPERSLEIPRLKLAAEATAPTTAGAAPARGTRCVSVGPFKAQASAERAVLWLRAMRLEPRVRTTENDAGTAFWVSASTPTLQQAVSFGTRLRAQGVTDVEILPPTPGGTQAIVSLGIYTSRERAEQRVADLRKHQIVATITEQGHTVPVWWVDVDLASGGRPVDVAAMQANLGGSDALALGSCPALLPPAPATGTPSAAAQSAPGQR
jgi:hypothetical protein